VLVFCILRNLGSVTGISSGVRKFDLNITNAEIRVNKRNARLSEAKLVAIGHLVDILTNMYRFPVSFGDREERFQSEEA